MKTILALLLLSCLELALCIDQPSNWYQFCQENPSSLQCEDKPIWDQYCPEGFPRGCTGCEATNCTEIQFWNNTAYAKNICYGKENLVQSQLDNTDAEGRPLILQQCYSSCEMCTKSEDCSSGCCIANSRGVGLCRKRCTDEFGKNLGEFVGARGKRCVSLLNDTTKRKLQIIGTVTLLVVCSLLMLVQAICYCNQRRKTKELTERIRLRRQRAMEIRRATELEGQQRRESRELQMEVSVQQNLINQENVSRSQDLVAEQSTQWPVYAQLAERPTGVTGQPNMSGQPIVNNVPIHVWSGNQVIQINLPQSRNQAGYQQVSAASKDNQK